MIKILSLWRVLNFLVVMVSISSGALAAGDRTAPSKPTNLRVTSNSAYQVSLAWNASTDNSGVFSYKVFVSYGSTYTVPQSQTTFSVRVAPNSTYSFYVYAVDGSGNASQKSNTVSPTTPRDTTAPSAPAVASAGVNPTEVSLQWTASIDDGPYVFYQVFVNGAANVDAGQNRFAVVHGLSPQTSYQITVKARDLYGAPNVSAPSNVLAVTTAAVSATDTTPPSAPTSLYGWDAGDGAREIDLFWTPAFDNQTAQAALVYEVYVNGVLDQTTGGDRAILYASSGGENVFTVIAVDAKGNHSAAASVTIVSE